MKADVTNEKAIWVTPFEDKWVIKDDPGFNNPKSIHSSKLKAEAEAKRLAEELNTRLIVLDEEGFVDYMYNYENGNFVFA